MSKSVLILEDAIFVREMEKKIIQESGYEVVGEANSHKEGVSLYQSLSPDLVIVDLQLAEGTGLDAMKDISSMNPKARFIVVTSHSAMLDSMKATLEPFIVGILDKPFAAKDLQGLLDKASP